MSLLPGTILGQYEIRCPLGAGGMGEVYRAHDTRLDRAVAIKVLPQSVTSDPERLRRFEQEARAAAALNHPNILAVYQMSTHEGGISYLVTELLDGETLRDRLRRGPIALRKAIDYAIQIAHGLAAPHEKGIVHRDLKPENLFLTRDERVKILDFGLAKVAKEFAPGGEATQTQETDPGMVVGTVGYMAPEQVRGKPADHRSDIFAFGTVLYELVTGKQTFRKPTSAETMTAILNEDPPSISQISPHTPPGLQRVVHRCLEKNPEQRFQSASDLAFALESLSDSGISSPSGAYAISRPGLTRLQIAIGAATLLLVIATAAVVYLWTRPPAVPTVSNYVQLTHDGWQKQIIGSDGSRLYLYLTAPDYVGMAEMAISGGEVKKLDILPTRNIDVLSLSSDGSELVVADAQGVPPKGAAWSVPILGGPPRRLGNMEVTDATWSPDKKMLVFSTLNTLLLAKGDGTEPHQLVTLKDATMIFNPTWSPDAAYFRFSTSEPVLDRIWEVSADGANLHPLPASGTGTAPACCGAWTANGRYFVYQSVGQIWALPSHGGFLHGKPKPIQLTSSPLQLGGATPSKDGKKLFVVGLTQRGELMRYDFKTGQFTPYLGGISGEYPAFSKDGQWAAYVSFPEGTLWRSKIDGSDRLQLTNPPAYAFLPRWSPDGKKIVFFSATGDSNSKIYEISAEGGSPEPLLPNDPTVQGDPNWSPDGSKIVFGAGSVTASALIRIVDLATRQVTEVPGSKGLFSPRYSPDGSKIAALSSDATRLMVYDVATQKWKEISKGTLGWPSWSKDGQSIFALDQTGTNAVLKIRVSDGKTNRVLDMKAFRMVGKFGLALAFAPDDSPLLLRYAGTQDVYALDWKEP